MDIRTLYRYLLLETADNITDAAEKAYMSRQAFAESMTHMETELGVKLFNRQKRGMTLTDEGRELQRFLKGWLPAWEKEQNILQEMEEHKQKVLHIACWYSNLSSVFFERMFRFENRQENVKVDFKEYTPQECFELFDRGEVDVVCGLNIGEHPGCIRETLPERGTETMLMMHKSHPLAQKDGVHTADLRGYPLVLSSKDQKPDRILENYAVPYGAIPLYIPLRNEPYSLSIMKEKNGLGLSSARNPNRFEKDGFIRKPLEDYPLDLSCCLYYKKDAAALVLNFADCFLGRGN